MPQRENLNSLDMDLGLTPTQLTATKSDVTIIDSKGYESVTYFLYVESVSSLDGSNYFTASINSGDNASLTDAAAVSSPQLVGSAVLNSTDTGFVGKIAYVNNQRYSRLVLTATGSPDAVIGVFAVKGHPLSAPVS
jgi:hypothetical protein